MEIRCEVKDTMDIEPVRKIVEVIPKIVLLAVALLVLVTVLLCCTH